MSRVRVLVVDDSATMRGILIASLRQDPDIEVVGTASDPYKAREAIKALDPDVITLDVEMPRMNGVEFLEKLMRLRPTPTIMVSTLTQKGAALAVEALGLGAFDCVGKPADGSHGEAFAVLPDMVKAAAKSRVRLRPQSRPSTNSAAKPSPDFVTGDQIVFIGSSTGGVDALATILADYPEKCPPTLITQHMMANFIESFAARLNKICAAEVVVARDRQAVEPGRVYIAPGGEAHLEISAASKPVCRLRKDGLVSGHRPSVDVLFRSAAKVAERNAVGVILTGMGADGAAGLSEIRASGGRTLGQNEATCVVYGMPRVAFENGAVERQVGLESIASSILSLAGEDRRKAAS